MKSSVVIAFYNNLQFLDLVLAGFSRQTEQDFEIILADDGSKKENASGADTLLEKYNLRYQHLWHADKGFRKNIMLNKAVLSSRSDRIIFIDQDCIPHREFVNKHIQYLHPGKVLAGRRVNLSKEFSASLTPTQVADGVLEKKTLYFFKEALLGRMNYAGNALYLPFISRFLLQRDKGIVGCNFSAMKSDLLDVNGFDERYLNPTIGEDSDIDYRLRLAGKKVLYVANLTLQYHLFHPLLSRKNDNYKIFEKMKSENKAWTDSGIVKRKKKI